ncbi:MAG: alpha/beta fold hydrolase [Alphaproteobacteria bacterium]|nr:alpha/beta fold hydrolase [Alphaproteobacteria bacterium]
MNKVYTDRQNMISDFIAGMPGSQSGAIVARVGKALGGRASRPTILRDIDALLSSGAIAKTGVGRATRYYIAHIPSHGGKSYQEKDQMMLDVLDSDGNITPVQMTKAEIHARGLWHREASLFIINTDGWILTQKRSQNVHFNRGKYGIVANHVRAGQTLVDAILEKAREELGLEIDEKEIRYMACQKRDEGNNKRFSYIYYIKTGVRESDINIDPYLATEYRWFGFQELFQKMMNNSDDTVFGYNPMFVDVFGELVKIIGKDNTINHRKNKEFIMCETADGVMLPGVIHRATRPASRIAIFFDGSGGNFFKTTYLSDLANELNERGIDLLSIDSRGREQEAVFYKQIGGRRERAFGGMKYENFDESVNDVQAAVEYVKSEGYADVILIGHSLGASKIMYYERMHGNIKNIILLSPADMISRFVDRVGERAPELLELAARNVMDGKPYELIIPQYSSVTVNTLFRPGGNADIFRLDPARAPCSLSYTGKVLIIMGASDGLVYRDWSREYLQDRFIRAFGNTYPEIKVIENADHMYKGYEKQLVRAIMESI